MHREPFELREGEVYDVGFSFRAIKEYEEMTGESVDFATTTWKRLQYSYCTLKALNKNFRYTFDEFVELLDANPETFIKLQQVGVKDEPVDEQPKKKEEAISLFVSWALLVWLLLLPVSGPLTFGIKWAWMSLKRLAKPTGKRKKS